MSIDSLIYERLQSVAGSLVGGTGGAFSSAFSDDFETSTPGRIYEQKPEENVENLPYLTYSLSGIVPGINLDGPSSLTIGTATVEVTAIKAETATTIRDAITTGLHGWRSLPVLLTWQTNSGGNDVEEGYQTSQEFGLAVKGA